MKCSIKLMQWNIHHGVDMLDRFDLQQQADVILQNSPDAVALNEVDKNCARTNYVNMAEKLGELTNMHALFSGCLAMPPEGLYGNAILSRYKIDHITSQLLPSVPREPRGVVIARINAPQVFYLAVTHLTNKQNDEENQMRVAELRAILQIIDDAKLEHPLVLAGDFNCGFSSDPIEFLQNNQWQLGEELPSYPAPAPEQSIDHIAYKAADKRLRITARKCINEKTASDHLPLINHLEIGG